MKEIKKNIDSETWAQLIDKIKDADDAKKRKLNELLEKIQAIIGDSDIKITIPKDFQKSNLLKHSA